MQLKPAGKSNTHTHTNQWTNELFPTSIIIINEIESANKSFRFRSHRDIRKNLPIWIEFCVSCLPHRCKSAAQFLDVTVQNTIRLLFIRIKSILLLRFTLLLQFISFWINGFEHSFGHLLLPSRKCTIDWWIAIIVVDHHWWCACVLCVLAKKVINWYGWQHWLKTSIANGTNAEDHFINVWFQAFSLSLASAIIRRETLLWLNTALSAEYGFYVKSIELRCQLSMVNWTNINWQFFELFQRQFNNWTKSSSIQMNNKFPIAHLLLDLAL